MKIIILKSMKLAGVPNLNASGIQLVGCVQQARCKGHSDLIMAIN
jgi:hypothetical protein